MGPRIMYDITESSFLSLKKIATNPHETQEESD